MKIILVREKHSKTKEFIYHKASDVYLWLFLKKWNKRTEEKHRVYDNLGLIDTLGYNSSEGKYTYSYSDELCYVFGFKIGGIKIEFIDY